MNEKHIETFFCLQRTAERFNCETKSTQKNSEAARFDASRPGTKSLESSRDKNEGVYRSGEGEEERACLVTPDLSYVWGGGQGERKVRR